MKNKILLKIFRRKAKKKIVESKIRNVTSKDIKAIYDIALANSIDSVDEKEGFLVSDYSILDYVAFLKSSQYFYVIEEESEVVGFLLAFKDKELDYNKLINQRYKKLLEKKDSENSFVVIKQVCIRSDKKRKGYGVKLYNYLMATTEDDIFTAVVLDPINEASVRFHKKCGFNELSAIVPEDGRMRGIYYWNNPMKDAYFEKEVILKEYEQAISLYLHEDSLNWSKTNNYFYVTGGIIVLLALLFNLNLPINRSIHTFLIITCFAAVIGIISSCFFRITLVNGIKYMQERKQSVINLENIICRHKGLFIVNIGFLKDKILKRSTTTKVLKRIPIAGIIVWSAIIILCIVLLLICPDYVIK